MNFKLCLMKYIPIILLTIFILSCSEKKHKPYEEVNIIKEEPLEVIPKKNDVDVEFPLTWPSQTHFLLELEWNSVKIVSWDKDSIRIEHSNNNKPELSVESYIGNSQVILREKLNGEKPENQYLWTCYVPEYLTLTLRLDNGAVEIDDVDGTFEIEATVDDISIKNSKSAVQVLSQSGDISLENWELKGRSKLSTASGNVLSSHTANLQYPLTQHSGSGKNQLILNGNELKTNLEVLKFPNGGKLQSDIDLGAKMEYYSDAIEKTYDRYEVLYSENAPLIKLTSGEGEVILTR